MFEIHSDENASSAVDDSDENKVLLRFKILYIYLYLFDDRSNFYR